MIDADGAGVPDAMVEIWQADPRGEYATGERHDGFSGFGRVPTALDGGFQFTTTKPGRVAAPDGKRQAPHVVVAIFMRGLLRHLNSRIYFPDEPGNSEDLLLNLVETGRRHTLIAREIAPRTFEWNVHLQGEDETVVLRLLMAADSPLLDPLFRGAAAAEVFSDAARLQGMLDFEAALARAGAKVGIIPQHAAEVIVERCRAALFDRHQLGAATATAGNPAIPLVAALTHTRRAEGCRHPPRYVHWGATSQDAIDTGLALQLRRGLHQFLPEVRRLADALATLAEAHASTPIVGRTWLQHAVPITFGLKVAGWCAAVDRARMRVEQAR